MRLYLAPTSSLKLIRYLRSTNGEEGLMGTPMRKRMLTDAINTSHAMDELDPTAQRWLEHAGSPVHALVPDRSEGTSTSRLVTHVHSGPMPYNTTLDLGHGICICSPRFTFMQMTTQVDLIEAILIGMELCGSYSFWRLEPHIMKDPYYLSPAEERACTFKLPTAMQSKRTCAFVEKQRGNRGALGARDALKWIIDNSASSMETAVYLLLCLPKRLGGYGLPKPILNPKLIISNPSGSKERYPDLFWPGANIDVEYNSDSKHSGEWTRYRDSKRAIELTVANIKVLPLTRAQLTRTTEFDAFAQGLRRMLGVRSRAADADWEYHRNELHRRLLSAWQ